MSAQPPALAELIACPRCEQSLRQNKDETWNCAPCGLSFPNLAGIPCLYPEPAAALAEWRQRWQFALEKLAAEVDSLKAELQQPRLRPLTRERLTQRLEATLDQGRRLRELLSPLALYQLQAGYATHLALQTRPPSDQGLTTYYANVHRDWHWGDAENQVSANLVRHALRTTEPLASLCVLGSGAGRLAYDLHQQAQPAVTVALDFNPLLAVIATSCAAGEPTSLWEFPIAPRSMSDQAILRELKAPTPAAPGFHPLLGDALRPPLLPGGLDAVVTPWLVDILPEDFRHIAARVNALLRPSGRWVCFGSLAFAGSEATTRYSLEEVLSIVMDSGFGEPQAREDSIPYMCSPASRHGRQEWVVTIGATKERSVARPPRPKSLPDWLVAGTQPVPLLPNFQLQAMTTRIYSFIMGLIDGRRSVKDIARLLEEQRLMSREEAEPAIRSFLTRMYEDAQRAGNP
jgi:uncharacterized protein YbaR (Trm112 family)